MFLNTLDKKSQIIYTLFKIPSKFNTPSGDVILTGYIVVDQKEKRVEIPKLKACDDFEQYKKEKERKKNKNLQKKLYKMKRKIESKGKIFDYNVYKKKAAETQKIEADNKLKKEEKCKNVHTQGKKSIKK